jgi:hypothetical protein
VFEFITVALLLYAAGGWLMEKAAKRPDTTFRGASAGCGLFLAVSMTIGGICFVSEPELDAGMGIYFFLWAVLGVVLIVKGVRGR